MNIKRILNILGITLLMESALMLLPLITAFVCGESPVPFLCSIAIAALAGFSLTRVKANFRDIFARDGFVLVSLVWIFMSLIGALPFVISGDIPRYIDALFETVSGFTTTGATVVRDVESMSRSCLFWRCFTHWIGGQGVLVFFLAVLPMSGDRSMHIMRAEVPGPVVGKLVPKARETARILYIIYTVLTFVETLLLMAGGLSFYDALLHAFGTAGTGGFSTRNASVGAFNSTYVEMVIAVFLVIFATNFNIYYLIVISKIKLALKSEEYRVFLAIIAVATIAIGISVGFKDAFFNVATIISTAGFGTVDFTKWPAYAQGILVILMFIGSSAGSTGGGIKVSRAVILMKDAFSDLVRVATPRRVKQVTLDGKTVDSKVVSTVHSFFVLFILLLLASTFIVSLDGYDFLTNFTASLACISNVGPGLSLVGPAGNYAIFSDVSKLALTFTMLAGRLELYPVFILFSPYIWKSIRK